MLTYYCQPCGEYGTPQNHIINLGCELFKSTFDSEASELLQTSAPILRWSNVSCFPELISLVVE